MKAFLLGCEIKIAKSGAMMGLFLYAGPLLGGRGRSEDLVWVRLQNPSIEAGFVHGVRFIALYIAAYLLAYCNVSVRNLD